MKFISWNTNGLRACVGKGFLDAFNALDADFFCLQETKLQAGQIDLPLEGYSQYWNYAEKKGYSGTAIFAKQAPVSVRYGLGQPELDTEGRLITLEYPGFFLVTCYTPNAQRGLARIDHRLKWDEAFRAYLSELDREKPVIACGDLNVAHQEIDLKIPPPTGATRASPTRNGKASGGFWTPGSPTPSAVSTRTPPARTHGGAICSTPGRTTRAGVSTISSSPTALRTKSPPRPSIRTSKALTTARWGWKSNCNVKMAGTETVPAILLFRNFDPHLFSFPNQIAFFQALYVGKGFLRGNGDKFPGGLVMLGQE